MTPDDEQARLAGFLAFYAEHPPDPEWEDTATDAERRLPGWLVDQQRGAVADTPALELAVVGAISRAHGHPARSSARFSAAPFLSRTSIPQPLFGRGDVVRGAAPVGH